MSSINLQLRDHKIKAYSRWLKIMGVESFAVNKNEHKLIQQVMQGLKASNVYSNSDDKLSNNMVNNKVESKLPSTSAKKVAKSLPPRQNQDSQSAASLSSRALADSAQTVAELKDIISKFNGCELKNFAKSTVFAQGNPLSDVMFIGEAPGATEDEKGVPFCGQSGQLLDNMLASIGLDRNKNAYITNTIFWRPPGNRRPTQEEIDICKPFVEKHIALAGPKLIVLVGSTAASSLLGKHEGISQIRRNFYDYNNDYLDGNIAMTAIFHPAYLMRQPSKKKDSWFDLLRIKHYINEKILSKR